MMKSTDKNQKDFEAWAWNEIVNPEAGRSFERDTMRAVAAHNLISLRNDAGITQQLAAAAVGVSRNTYKDWEDIRHEAPTWALAKLAFLYDVDLLEMVTVKIK